MGNLKGRGYSNDIILIVRTSHPCNFSLFSWVPRLERKFILQYKQGVQWLQTFAFCAVTVNDEHTKPRFKRKLRG